MTPCQLKLWTVDRKMCCSEHNLAILQAILAAILNIQMSQISIYMCETPSRDTHEKLRPLHGTSRCKTSTPSLRVTLYPMPNLFLHLNQVYTLTIINRLNSLCWVRTSWHFQANVYICSLINI